MIEKKIEEQTVKKVIILPNNLEIRRVTSNIEEAIRKLPNALIGDSPEYLAVCPLKHTFVDGAYVREIFLPKGMIFVTKIHKKTHPYFILKGDVSVLTEEGVKRIKAPFNGITLTGTKRVIYTHEDTVWITVHVTDETDLKKIENEVIAQSFDELDNIVDVEIVGFINEIKEEKDVKVSVGSL